jgi:predicted transcriptional regulator
MTHKKRETEIRKLVRTSVLVPEEIDSALRELAIRGQRPLSWEIRIALEKHVKAELKKAAA